ncbi:MAG: phosphoheptose isomerase [Balneolales bacterium]
MLQFDSSVSQDQVFSGVRKFLVKQGFLIADQDDTRPWGGYFVIVESQAADFIQLFFPDLSMSDFEGFQKLSPKILLVSPNKRLSWQYHLRRSEIWKVIGGRASVTMSKTDEEPDARPVSAGTVIELERGLRHRLIGLDEWGIIAEIWKHIDPENPSDEDDIIRVQDDFGR